MKSAAVDDYEDYMKTHSQSFFRVPDKPSNHTHGTPSTPRKVMSKLNSLTRQLTGSDQQDDNAEPANLPEGGLNGEIPKSDSSHSLDIPNSRILWQVNPRPQYSAQYYHFTLFSMSLNQLTDDFANSLPPTDSRFRPDVRKLEEGDLGNYILTPIPFALFLTISILQKVQPSKKID